MKSMTQLIRKVVLIPLAVAALVTTGPMVFAQGVADLTGTWSVTTATPRGDQTETLTLGEDGSGTYGSQEVTLTLEADEVSFDAVRETPRGNIPLSLVGKVDGDSITGTYTMDASALGGGGMGGGGMAPAGGMGGGGMAPAGDLTWSATRSAE